MILASGKGRRSTMSLYTMNRHHVLDRYYILVRDLCFNRPTDDLRSRKYDSISNISEYLKGTLLQEVLLSQNSKYLTFLVIDTQEIIKCAENDVEKLTEDVMLLLLAISSCKERYEVFQNYERLADGLEMEPGWSVTVRHPQAGEINGKLRYKGKIHNRMGTYFGVEFINGRGKGNTNGTLSKYKYFDCAEDSGMFVALNRVMSKKYDQQRTVTPTPRNFSSLNSNSLQSSAKPPFHQSPSSFSVSSHPSLSEPVIGVSQQELDRLGIYIGMEVCIFTEVNGKESQENGTVKFIGRIPDELPTDGIYVGIDLVNPVGNGRGVFNKRHLFKTKRNHAALVPLSGVLPAATCDTTSPLQPNGGATEDFDVLSFTNEPALQDRKFNTEPRRRSPVSEPAFFSNGRHLKREFLASESNQRHYASDPNPRRSFGRGPPDGSPLPGLDESQPSLLGLHRDNRKAQLDLDKKSNFNTFPNMRTQTTKSANNRLPYDDSCFLEKESMVEIIDGVEHLGDIGLVGPVYGVIKWIGTIPDHDLDELMAGIELDMAVPGQSDGTLNGRRYFTCMPDRAFFTYLRNCRRDRRFTSPDDDFLAYEPPVKEQHFGDFEASGIPGKIPPPSKLTDDMVGKGKGIQGHHNSCYLDSTLFSMFSYSYCLDSILYRKSNSSDLPQYKEVQKVLVEDIVNPLRKRNFVRADCIMKLRKLLDELGSVTGLTNEEKDPEEFLQTLLNHVFKADPLFELRQGDADHVQECYFYQIFFDKDEKMVLPSTQLLMEQSFLASDLKFREVPSCLILQMPRFGKDYKMYNRVRPSLTIDVTDMVEKLPRNCTVCGGLAEYECKACSIERSMQEHISSYCDQCVKICHQHPLRRQHKYKKIEVCDEYRSFVQHDGEPVVDRHVLELYAVVCIETSHYVSFAKCGYGRKAKWCFFDSMADRIGEQSGYNIPEVTYVEQFEEWLAMDQSKLLEIDRKDMPEHMRRLLCDAYMCLYQSREMMCYS